MKAFLWCLPYMLCACTPSADNLNNNPQRDLSKETASENPEPAELEENPVELPSAPAGDTTSENPRPPQPEDGPTVPDDTSNPSPVEASLPGCLDASPSDSYRRLIVERDPGSGNLSFDFLNRADRKLRVISFYVTAPGDEVPTFENGFSFRGKAYWMVSLEDPFETYFQLPVTYGQVPGLGVDVTENYGGRNQGALLSTLTKPACLKATVITFEPEETTSFRTSTYLLSYRP